MPQPGDGGVWVWVCIPVWWDRGFHVGMCGCPWWVGVGGWVWVSMVGGYGGVHGGWVVGVQAHLGRRVFVWVLKCGCTCAFAWGWGLPTVCWCGYQL